MPALAHGATGASPWDWQPHVDTWLLVLALSSGYLLAIRFWKPADVSQAGKPVSRGRRVAFFLGVASLWLAEDWPLHELSEGFLLSAHMVQHLLFTLVAPPLLLLGLPRWMLRKLLGAPPVMQVVRRLTRPLVALLLFNTVFLVTHWTVLVDLSLRSTPVHVIVHGALLISALLMWWPVVGPLPETPRLSDPAKMLYLFAQSILPTVPASFLTFTSAPIYHFYETVPRVWGISVVNDHRIAGLIMKILGGLLLWTVIAVLFFKWSAKEESDTAEEVAWDDFEHELEALHLRK